MQRTPTPEALQAVPDEDHLAPGTLINARYRIRRVIGRGGVGVVYEAEHVRVERPVAVKLMDRRAALDESARRHFQKEARAASAAGHPNIIEIFDAGDMPDGRPYLVMELLRGQSLAEVLEKEKTLPVERACAIVRDVARALQAAHDVGVIHRDLKPENIFLAQTKTGEMVKVLDFGIAFEISEADRRLTRPGMAIGTPDYMAPEQTRGAPGAPAIDIYALGVILYELLAGVAPFSHCSTLEAITKKLVEPAPPLQSHRQDIPARLEALIESCLEIDADHRPPSAGGVADELEAILVDPNPRPGAVGARVSPVATVAAVAVISAAVGVAVWTFATERRAGAETTAVVSAASDPDPEPPNEPSVEVVPSSAPEVTPPPDPATGAPSKPPASAPDPHQELPDIESLPEKEAVPEPAEDPRVVKETVERHRTPECARTRKRAEEARSAHDWSLLRKLAKDIACWPSRNEARKLRVMAHMELGEFEECVEAGRQVADSQVKKWVTLCEHRLGGGAG